MLSDDHEPTADEITPGMHEYTARAGFKRRFAEQLHNAALEAGYESEIRYYKGPDAWEVYVREAGSGDPPFLDDGSDLGEMWTLGR